MCTSGVSEGKTENTKERFEKKMTMNFPEPRKDTNSQIKEAQHLSRWTNNKKATPGHNVMKTHTTKDQQKGRPRVRRKTHHLWRNDKQIDRRNDRNQNTVNSNLKMLEEVNLKLDICAQENDLRMKIKYSLRETKDEFTKS